MKKMLVFGVMAGALAIAGACWAYPSLLGPTGGANLPVASVIGEKQWSAALDYVGGFSVQDEFGTFDFSNTIALRTLYGVAPNAEVGVTYNNADIDFTDPIEPANNQSSDLSGVGFNAKYLWPDIVANMPVAAGIVYQNLGDTTVTQLYGVGTRLFSAGSSSAPAIRGTLGANWTNVKYDDGTSDDAIRPFIDVDIAFASGLNITAEYQLKSSKLGDESPVSTLAARYPLNADKSLIGQIGLTNAKFGVLGTEKHTMVLGVNYLFGK